MVIPWSAALRAAEALFAATASRRATATNVTQWQDASERLVALEQHHDDTANLLLQLADQLRAQATASDAQARTVRRLRFVAVAGLVVATAGLVAALLR